MIEHLVESNWISILNIYVLWSDWI